ncbi:histidine--tRNA ligase [Candidatus Nesciobacter abundans]|uniref:Histidine--tRNA ligase n=1 Tax=Candidatus Nesciobacter abundans TaxID=2601668 RepID=A0A5C0UHF1_9PROT|nr:histidine--tRNA ligase [Candidatus Nesciobacter abundans]QEK39101.1 histidine--tRNA ligase [Candidatus Nesciobacter abundans]
MGVRGTKDWVQNYKKYREIINVFEAHTKTHGFDQINPSILENASLFSRSVGEDSDIMNKEMFYVISKESNSMDTVLRPEFTTSVIRALLESNSIQNKKVSYYGPVFRHNRPQKGRLREFTQLGCEVLEDSPYVDADVILCAYKIVKDLDINISIKINTLGSKETLNTYIKEIESLFYKLKHEDCTDFVNLKENSASKNTKDFEEGPRKSEKLTEIINKIKSFDIKNPIRILDKMSSKEKVLLNIPKISDFLDKESLDRFSKVCIALKEMKVPFEVDPYLVRGLDYYKHTVFEFEDESESLGKSILGGGCYQGLVKSLGGPDINGVGWSFGLERMALLINTDKLSEENIIAVIPINKTSKAEKEISIEGENLEKSKQNNPEESEAEKEHILNNIYVMKVAEKIRKNINKNSDIKLILFHDEWKKSMKKLSKINPSMIVFCGKEERNEMKITIKNCSTKEQKNISYDDIETVLV